MSETLTEPVIMVTEDAARQVGIVRANEPENEDKTLRIFVEEGGCSGFQYGMVFDEKRDKDHAVEFLGKPFSWMSSARIIFRERSWITMTTSTVPGLRSRTRMLSSPAAAGIPSRPDRFFSALCQVHQSSTCDRNTP